MEMYYQCDFLLTCTVYAGFCCEQKYWVFSLYDDGILYLIDMITKKVLSFIMHRSTMLCGLE